MSGPWEKFAAPAAGPWTKFAPPADEKPYSVTDDMSFGDKALAGAGSAVQDVVDATKQLVGAGPNAEQVRERKKIDAPLTRTAGGFFGKAAGNLAMFAPLAVVPGAATVGGAAALGATAGALQPTESTGERLGNMAVGGALGGGSQAMATTGAKLLGERAAKQESEAVAAESRNAVRDATLKEGQAAGYVVPPSSVNPSFWNKRAESIAGKAAVGQEAAARNQKVTNKLASEALGLPADTPITEKTLTQLRNTAAQPYREVAALSPEAATKLEQLKEARFNANSYQKFYERSADPAALKEARAAGQSAQQLEQEIEAIAAQSGAPDLVSQLREARTLIAKTYDVEKALNVATGDVSARVLGRAADSGRLTGPLATAGKFYEAFPSYARDGARIPTPGVSKSEALTAALLGTTGAAAAGPVGALAGALPLASGPVRSMVLSQPYQARMAAPQYPHPMLKNISPEDVALLARSIAMPGAAYAGAQQ